MKSYLTSIVLSALIIYHLLEQFLYTLMLILPDVQADDCYNKKVLFEATSIGDWTLPAVYAGHLSAIIWYKMDWASQIPVGCYTLGVGQHKTSGKLR